MHIETGKVFRLLETVEYQTGEIIFRKGEQPSHIYIIATGQVEMLLEGKRYVLERAIFEVGIGD